MNPLPWHLFTNGKFSIKHADKNGNGTVYEPNKWGVSEGEVFIMDDNDLGMSWPLMSQVMLIARPVETLTDEEIRSLKPGDIYSEDLFTPEFIDWYKEILKEYPPDYGISSVDFLRLLELEVYPGPQEDFGDTVIDTRTLTNV